MALNTIKDGFFLALIRPSSGSQRLARIEPSFSSWFAVCAALYFFMVKNKDFNFKDEI